MLFKIKFSVINSQPLKGYIFYPDKGNIGKRAKSTLMSLSMSLLNLQIHAHFQKIITWSFRFLRSGQFRVENVSTTSKYPSKMQEFGTYPAKKIISRTFKISRTLVVKRRIQVSFGVRSGPIFLGKVRSQFYFGGIGSVYFSRFGSGSSHS